MSVREWHVGKLVILWGVCAVWFWALTEGLSRETSAVIASAWFAYLLFCLVVTWVWFGGREGKR